MKFREINNVLDNRYKACDGDVKDKSVVGVFETFDTRVTLTELRPYSR